MKTSEAINELAAALSKAQGEFSAAERGHTAIVRSTKGEGSSYQYNYADLAAYLDVVRGPLSQHGLAIVQSVSANDDVVTCVSRLFHASGQWLESDPLPIVVSHPPDRKPTPQEIGSACTYCRRYSLAPLLGMASEADDDGAGASGLEAETTKREPLPTCPKCKKTDSVIVGRPEYGGGFVCYAKKGGCGHKWQKDQSEEAPKQPKRNEPLSPAEEKYIVEARQELTNAKSVMDYHAIWTIILTKPQIIQDALRPFAMSRYRILKQDEEAESKSLEVAAAAAK